MTTAIPTGPGEQSRKHLNPASEAVLPMSERLLPEQPPPANTEDWGIDSIVGQLRELREASLAARQRQGKPPKLPSRKVLAGMIEGFSAALFPNRLGQRSLVRESTDYFVGHMLDVTCRDLFDQILLELQFAAGMTTADDLQRSQAQQLVRQFLDGLPAIRRLLETDIRAAYEGDPAARSTDEVLVCYPGITAMIHHRLAHKLYRIGLPLIARMIAELAHSSTGIDIHPGASIQGQFFIDHGTGVVIGESAVIGARVRLYHGVTLGAKRFLMDDAGALVKGTPRHPIVEDDVVIYAGATILGRITIGRGSIIGGNVWLTRSVPPGSNVSQAQLRSELYDEGSGI